MTHYVVLQLNLLGVLAVENVPQVSGFGQVSFQW